MYDRFAQAALRRLILSLIVMAAALTGCGGASEETVAGVKIPIPSGMSKSQAKGIEFSLPGLGGAQTSFQGSVEPDKIVEFYKKEMPARGWEPSMGLISKGGMLTYTKENQTVVVMVTKNNGGTNLSLTVGGTGR